MVYADSTTTYRWPFVTGQGADTIISNFCDFRPQDVSTPHFHEGIDIRACSTSRKAYDVISITSGYEILSNPDSFSYGWIVKTRFYTDDTLGTLIPNQGAHHIHMLEINDSLQANKCYINTYLSHQTKFWRNHLHLEYIMLGTNSYSKNPFHITELPIPLADATSPILNKIYVDYFVLGSATVDSLNFLGYNFDQLYNSGTFKECSLPTSTPANDLDDPHIMVYGNRIVKFVLQGWDHFNKTDDYATPSIISTYIDHNISSLEKACYIVRFDSLLSSPDEVHQEEDVYYVTAPCSSAYGSAQYYRLYPHDNSSDGMPGCIITDTLVVDSVLVKTDNLEEGMHRFRVVAEDKAGHKKTGDIHFYLRINDWVDISRSFQD